jgi:RHS repeat-associated protein
MDALTYSYTSGNKLLGVSDASGITFGFLDGNTTGDDYDYDGNANLIQDLNKGIAAGGIEYNHLNMPTKITVTGSNSGTLDYIYAADRSKLRKINSNGTTTDYIGGYVYENGNLKQITHPEGYIEPDGQGGYDYVYRYVDIWGNTRLTYADDDKDGSINPASEIRREQNYYPFGLEHNGYNNVSYGVKNNLKTYQGQEFTEDLDLNTHEWRYRISDPTIGRFWQVDPLAEDYVYNSTYAFQENKMGMGIELEGLEKVDFKKMLKEGTKKTSEALGKLGNNFTTGEAKRQIQNGMSSDPSVEVKNEQEKKTITESATVEFKEGVGPALKGIAFEAAEQAQADVRVVEDVIGTTALAKVGTKALPVVGGVDALATVVKMGLYASEGDTEGVIVETADYFVNQGTGELVNESPLPEVTKPAISNLLMRIYDYLVGDDE